ncbi:MAG: diaminopimelate epimerase [Verrucomicrobia bacterium]|nr:diaminopimelate epimerase [Verrucomicrobiota bacterium]
MISFSKYQGAGNDFILIDDRSLSFNTASAKALCHRKFGIGADGLILLQNDPAADFRMRIFNADGSEAEGCGNGLRCFVHFLAELGFKREFYRIAIHNRIEEAFFSEEDVRIKMADPEHLCLNLPLNLEGERHLVHSVDTGVPHLVYFVEELATIGVASLGSKLRHHPAFAPKGTNVNFAALQKDASVAVRTYERGVEGETLACGTGAAAVAIVAAHLFDCPSPVRLCFLGGEIEISFSDRGLSDLQMTGPAKKVFSGHFSL